MRRRPHFVVEYDFSVDWRALGVQLYEVLAGESPFKAVRLLSDHLISARLEPPVEGIAKCLDELAMCGRAGGGSEKGRLGRTLWHCLYYKKERGHEI